MIFKYELKPVGYLIEAQVRAYGWSVAFSTEVACAMRAGMTPLAAFEHAVGDGERPYDPFASNQ